MMGFLADHSLKVARLAEAAVMLSFDVFGWNMERFGLEILLKFQRVCVLNSLCILWNTPASCKLTYLHHIGIAVRELTTAVMGVFKHLINQASFKFQTSTFLD